VNTQAFASFRIIFVKLENDMNSKCSHYDPMNGYCKKAESILAELGFKDPYANAHCEDCKHYATVIYHEEIADTMFPRRHF
jgi:hypothetical protein